MLEKERPRIIFFHDSSSESQRVKQMLEERGEKFNSYNIHDLKFASGDEIGAPTIFAPKGTFRGFQRIEVALRNFSSHGWSLDFD